MEVYCDNGSCKHCYKNCRGEGVCNADGAISIGGTSEGMHDWFVVCESYKHRGTSTTNIPKLFPGMDKNGLLPGQIKYGGK
jgi:hypothetical protein